MTQGYVTQGKVRKNIIKVDKLSMFTKRIRSIDRLRNLIKESLSKREASKQSIYEVMFTNGSKEKMLVFHRTKRFFEYNITDKEIISFKRINQCTKSNLDAVCKILKLPGEFSNKYKRIGYDLVYFKEGKFYDEKMNKILYNLDKKLKEHTSKINKERYNKIRKIMSSGEIQLDEIPGHKTWMKKIKDKWYTFSDLDKDVIFPILAKEVFEVISYGLDYISSNYSSSYIYKTKVYKYRYNDYITKKIDSGELKKWEIYIKNYCKYKFRLVKLKDTGTPKGEGAEQSEEWILESEGEITFDKRTMNRSQVKDFIRYILSIEPSNPLQDLGHLNYWDWSEAPDIIKNTPINLSLEEKKFDHKMVDLIKIVGKEIRINYRNIQRTDNKIHKEFVAISIYGKECTIFEQDIDILLRDGYFYKIFQRFDEELAIERSSERIALLKIILPEFKLRYPIILDEIDKKLIMFNRVGEFQISIIDAALTKKIGKESIYICVGSNSEDMNVRPFIMQNGVIYEIDFIMDEILSKMIMLIEEKYPDIKTERQINYRPRKRDV